MRRVFLASANTLSGLVRIEIGGYSATAFLAPLQPMFYSLRLLYATRAFTVDYRVRLIDASLEEGVVTSS